MSRKPQPVRTNAINLPPELRDAPEDQRDFYLAWSACRREGALVPRLSDYLDAPSFRLQPYVTIVDLYAPNDARIRYFGTSLATLAGQDLTAQSIAPIYTREDMERAAGTAWIAAGHPAGYTCLRAVRASNDMTIECESICLPLLPGNDVPRCMITLIFVPDDLPRLALEKDVRKISAFRWLKWIDLGAGVPS